MVQKVWRAFPKRKLIRWLVIVISLLMLAAIFYGMFARRSNKLPFTWLATIGLSWGLVSLWFLVGGLVIDAWNLLLRIISLRLKKARKLMLPLRWSVILLAVLCATGIVWGLIGARTLTVHEEHFDLGSTNEKPIRIAHISDLHINDSTDIDYVKKIVERLRELKPDIIVSTGDFIDSPPERIEEVSALFATLEPPLGKFAVLGNHEFHTGIEESLEFHKAAGFHLLREDAEEVCPGLFLVGVDDPISRWTGQQSSSNERKALEQVTGSTTILLKHRPDISDDLLDKFDLQLSGHTHGGQVFPWMFAVRAVFPRYKGRYELPGGTSLYVNQGTGTWGPPLRLGTSAEITLIIIEPDGSE